MFNEGKPVFSLGFLRHVNVQISKCLRCFLIVLSSWLTVDLLIVRYFQHPLHHRLLHSVCPCEHCSGLGDRTEHAPWREGACGRRTEEKRSSCRDAFSARRTRVAVEWLRLPVKMERDRGMQKAGETDCRKQKGGSIWWGTEDEDPRRVGVIGNKKVWSPVASQKIFSSCIF